MSEAVTQGVGSNIGLMVGNMAIGPVSMEQHSQEDEVPLMNNEQDEYVLETKLKIIEILHVSSKQLFFCLFLILYC